MAYTDDWENLMNGVFGAGGRPRFGGTAQPESKTPKAKAPAMPDLNAALLENQKQLDALLKKQNAQLKTQDTAVQSALEDSRQMLRDMEADGLLAKGTADVTAEHLGSFEGAPGASAVPASTRMPSLFTRYRLESGALPFTARSARVLRKAA